VRTTDSARRATNALRNGIEPRRGGGRLDVVAEHRPTQHVEGEVPARVFQVHLFAALPRRSGAISGGGHRFDVGRHPPFREQRGDDAAVAPPFVPLAGDEAVPHDQAELVEGCDLLVVVGVVGGEDLAGVVGRVDGVEVDAELRGTEVEPHGLAAVALQGTPVSAELVAAQLPGGAEQERSGNRRGPCPASKEL
jgi:hypothetical protein